MRSPTTHALHPNYGFPHPTGIDHRELHTIGNRIDRAYQLGYVMSSKASKSPRNLHSYNNRSGRILQAVRGHEHKGFSLRSSRYYGQSGLAGLQIPLNAKEPCSIHDDDSRPIQGKDTGAVNRNDASAVEGEYSNFVYCDHPNADTGKSTKTGPEAPAKSLFQVHFTSIPYPEALLVLVHCPTGNKARPQKKGRWNNPPALIA